MRAGAAREDDADGDRPSAGAACHTPPDEEALARELAEAFLLEADFQSERADAVRGEVVAAFHAEPQPSPRLRLLAGEAAIALAASALASGEREEAARLAFEAMRDFADTPVDRRRHPPAVLRLLSAAREESERARTLEVSVGSAVPGRLFADGNDRGLVTGELKVALAPGRRRLWLEREGVLSLPYTVEVAGTPVRVELTPALDALLRFGRPVVVACEPDACPELLARLRERLGVDEAIGVGTAAGATQVQIASASEGHRTLSVHAFVRERAPAAALGSESRPPATWPAALWQEHGVAVVAGSAGLLSLAVGAVLGLRSRASFAAAGETGISRSEFGDRSASGRRQAIAANVLFGVAGVALATAGVSVVFRW